MRPVLSVLLFCAAMTAAGCATVASGRFSNPMTFTETDADTVEHVARRVLRELRFDIEYPESSEGRLATDSLTGASWFEFWRKDTVGAMQRLESSLHTIRRRATVSISPKDGGSQVFVKVIKQRKSAPGLGPETIGQAFNIYDAQDMELVRQSELAPTEYEWLDMGRDELLEQDILQRILTSLK